MQIPTQILTDSNLTFEERFLLGYYYSCWNSGQIEKINNKDTLETLNLQYHKLNSLRNSLIEKGYIVKGPKKGTIEMGNLLDLPEVSVVEEEAPVKNEEPPVIEDEPPIKNKKRRFKGKDKQNKEGENIGGLRYDLYQFATTYSNSSTYDNLQVSIGYPQEEKQQPVEHEASIEVTQVEEIKNEDSNENEAFNPSTEETQIIPQTEEEKVFSEWDVLTKELVECKTFVADRKVNAFVNGLKDRFQTQDEINRIEKRILEAYFQIWKKLNKSNEK